MLKSERWIVNGATYVIIGLALWSLAKTVFGPNNPLNLFASCAVVTVAMFIRLQWAIYGNLVCQQRTGTLNEPWAKWALKLLAVRPPQVMPTPTEKPGSTDKKTEQGE